MAEVIPFDFAPAELVKNQVAAQRHKFIRNSRLRATAKIGNARFKCLHPSSIAVEMALGNAVENWTCRSMSLSETTRRVLHLVEERSGIPVHVEPDPNLPGTLLAKVVMARGKLALHQVYYRPSESSPPDYLICHQAGFILRLFENPPEKRFEFASAPAGRLAVEQLVKAHPVARLVPTEQLPKFCDMLRDGLLNHLRSIPVGMRVDRWLANDFPDLADLQKQAVLRQVQDSAATLAAKHRETSPKLIYDATQAISAAFTAFWSNRFQQQQLVLPFKAAGYLPTGIELLAIWDKLPEAPENDRLIVDRWAEELGIADWYHWMPYSSPK